MKYNEKNDLPLSLTVMMALIASCKKNNNEPLVPPLSFPDFLPLKMGNYCVYQQFHIDAAGNATPKDVFVAALLRRIP